MTSVITMDYVDYPQGRGYFENPTPTPNIWLEDLSEWDIDTTNLKQLEIHFIHDSSSDAECFAMWRFGTHICFTSHDNVMVFKTYMHFFSFMSTADLITLFHRGYVHIKLVAVYEE